MHLKNFSKTPVDSGVFYFIKKKRSFVPQDEKKGLLRND
jgi:hypothetical protein